MKVIVCGSRYWTDKEFIKQELKKFPPNTRIIQGGCRGADRIAGTEALSLGMSVTTYEADWNKYFKAAGPMRNQQMLDEEKPDLVLAFKIQGIPSKGTSDMISRAKKAGCVVQIFESENDE